MAKSKHRKIARAGLVPAHTQHGHNNLCPDSILRLPNEMLLMIGRSLDIQSTARLARTSRLFYQLLADCLYQKSDDENKKKPRSVEAHPGKFCWDASYRRCFSAALDWGIEQGLTATMRRALDVPGAVRRLQTGGCEWRCVYSLTLACALDRIPQVLGVLLEYGAPVNVSARDGDGGGHGRNQYQYRYQNQNQSQPRLPSFWPLLFDILVAHTGMRCYCPAGVLQAFFARGASLHTGGGEADRRLVLQVWDKLLYPDMRRPGIRLIRPPPHLKTGHGRDVDDMFLNAKYRDCRRHHSVACHTELIRLVLKHAPNPGLANLVFDCYTPGRLSPIHCRELSLLEVALRNSRAPLDLVKPLVEGGAELRHLWRRRRIQWGPDDRFVEYHEPTIHAVLRDAIHDRYGVWQEMPNNHNSHIKVVYQDTQKMVKYLLSKGEPFDAADVDLAGQTLKREDQQQDPRSTDDKTLCLLFLWNPHWYRYCKSYRSHGGWGSDTPSPSTRPAKRRMSK